MSWLSQWLNPEGAYDSAKGATQQYYNNAQGYNQPYADKGNQVGQGLQDMFNKLSNPAALQDEWNKTYQTSEHAKQLQKEASDQGMGAASGMGLMGSSSALQNIQKGNTNIMNEDRQNYMKDLMEKYMQGIGLGNNMYNQGASAAGRMGENSMTQGTTEGNLNFGRYNSGPNRMEDIVKQITQMMGGYFGGGMGQGSYGRGAFQPSGGGY